MSQHIRCSIDKDIVKKARANFMKPSKKVIDGRIHRMQAKDKNLWIIGSENKLEEFIKSTIGDSWKHVYNKTNDRYWNDYDDQPFVVMRIFDKKDRKDVVRQIINAGDDYVKPVETYYKDIILDPNEYHCIVLSKFTPEEYCEGLEKQFNLKSIKRRYDTLNLN